jgi:catechol 2,3-dioxygenase-like lactoylglutathione lyase family enzyme
MLSRIDHVAIVVEDISLVQAFFEKLGFVAEHSGELEGEWISKIVGLENVKARYSKLRLGKTETALELLQYDRPTCDADEKAGQSNRPGYRHIALEVGDIEEVYRQLEGQGVEILSEIQSYEPTNKRLVYFRGPENILLELAQYA